MTTKTKILMNKKRRSEIKATVIRTLQMYKKPLGLPVPIKAITKSLPNVRLIPYSTQMKRRNLNYSQMISFAGTEDACTDYDANSDLFVIYYNDVSYSHTSSMRYRWSIAHELGHIVLEHHKKYSASRIFRNSLSPTLYQELEDEADMFAAYILVPHIVVSVIGADSDHLLLKNTCRISRAAAEYRLRMLWDWRSQSGIEAYDFALLNRFRLFIDKSSCPQNMQSWLNTHRSCPKCHTPVPTLRSHRTHYCAVCGSTHPPHYEKEKKIMVYPGISTHDNFNAIECPVCHNTEATADGTHCMICGEELINICTSYEYSNVVRCDNSLPGNARYCPQCGSPSSFLKRGLLKSWDGKPFVDKTIGELPF